MLSERKSVFYQNFQRVCCAGVSSASEHRVPCVTLIMHRNSGQAQLSWPQTCKLLRYSAKLCMRQLVGFCPTRPGKPVQCLVGGPAVAQAVLSALPSLAGAKRGWARQTAGPGPLRGLCGCSESISDEDHVCFCDDFASMRPAQCPVELQKQLPDPCRVSYFSRCHGLCIASKAYDQHLGASEDTTQGLRGVYQTILHDGRVAQMLRESTNLCVAPCLQTC